MSETDPTLTPSELREEVLDALRERYTLNSYVRSRDIDDEVDTATERIGRALSRLEDEGYLERYRETSQCIVWRMTDRVSRKPLKFASGPQTNLALSQASGELAATIRYEDELGIEEGDVIDVLTAHTGESIGSADVEHTEIVEVRKALDVVHGRWAQHGAQTPEDLLKRLNHYYDDVLYPTTDVKVITLNPSIRESEVEDGR